MTENLLKKALLGPLVGVLIGLGISGWIHYFNSNKIPEINKVQQGFIAPSKLEIKCEDLDSNGEPETQVRIGDKTYLLREVDGQPVLSPYEVKSLT